MMRQLIEQIRKVSIIEANAIIRQTCGVVDFFSSSDDIDDFVDKASSMSGIACEERVAYGDWQTPRALAENICRQHLQHFGNPDIVIEPTCGLGAFVLAALNVFTNVTEIYAIEINNAYCKELKYKILTEALNHPHKPHPNIYIYTADIFNFNLIKLFGDIADHRRNIAIIGNPPWVTNSKQGELSSKNIPLKSNKFNLKGIDAITGKSNFDISEAIALTLLSLAKGCNGGISMLLKNSVIRNIVEKQKVYPLDIGELSQKKLDAKAEFNVSVEASCFCAKFTPNRGYQCKVSDLYSGKPISEYGWVGPHFVANTALYRSSAEYDGKSSYEWRSGVKHDCSSVLELTLTDGHYQNGQGEIVDIEDDLIFPLLKSSDVYKGFNQPANRYVIIPQRKANESTSHLVISHPRAYKYLNDHKEMFANRKSMIYKDKGPFAVFGIGDYSFKPYKIAVSSLYKDITFNLIPSIGGKPVMLDDTCYQLGFDTESEAQAVYRALTSDEITNLLKSIVFLDAKRVVTKNILMRIDISKILDYGNGN